MSRKVKDKNLQIEKPAGVEIETEQVKEIRKKSIMNCRNHFDLEKLVVSMPSFLNAVYEEQLEEVIFIYDIREKRLAENIKKEDKEKQYQFLINFANLGTVWLGYRIPLSADNLYYDGNYMPYVKSRDLYEQGMQGTKEEFLFYYKTFVGGILGKQYTVQKLQESGLEVLKAEPSFKEYGESETVEELVQLLKERRQAYVKRQKETQTLVPKAGYRVRSVLAIAAPVLLAAALGVLAYVAIQIVPSQKSVIAANEAYVRGDYVACIDSVKETDPEGMNINTKYILAVSYAKSESLKREEIADIISKLSLQSNEKELEYWIYLGRLDTAKAEDIAQALSDDKLLMYAYMKELNQLESDTAITGEEKQKRITTLEGHIQKLGEKYAAEDEEQ